MMKTAYSDPQTILKAFEKLREDYQRQETQIATQQDLAAKKADQDIVKQSASYTSESIFQALAQLQSKFGQTIDGLGKEMTAEVEKLAQIQRAIQVENQRLETLHHIQIAAEALNILQQEHQKEMQSLEQDNQQKHDTLDKEMSKQRDIWQQQAQEYEQAKIKQQSLIDKKRQFEEDEYHYKLKRQRKEETDEYDKHKRALERQLTEEQQSQEKNWAEREQFLDQHQAQFEEYKTKLESIPKEIEEAVKKAREEAIKETYKEEDHKAKLRDKEVEAKRKAFELRIESLNKTVEEQKVQINQLFKQLQTADQQVQQLATTAVSSGGVVKPGDKKLS